LNSFSTRPFTMLARMFSGLDLSSLPISISVSLASASGLTSAIDTYSTSGHAATCMAMSFASVWNFSPRATKSVSQLTSTSTPRRDPAWMYACTRPSAATRPAFLLADARHFLRRYSVAFSRSLSHSASAFLQSIIPAPVASRSSLAGAAGAASASVLAGAAGAALASALAGAAFASTLASVLAGAAGAALASVLASFLASALASALACADAAAVALASSGLGTTATTGTAGSTATGEAGRSGVGSTVVSW